MNFLILNCPGGNGLNAGVAESRDAAGNGLTAYRRKDLCNLPAVSICRQRKKPSCCYVYKMLMDGHSREKVPNCSDDIVSLCTTHVTVCPELD